MSFDLLKPKGKQIDKEPLGKIKISRIYLNKCNGQVSIVLPKKKLKSIPSRVEIIYWK